MIENKREYGLNILKKILTALHEKRFGDVVKLVDESTLDEEELVEYVQGTVELNNFNTMDEYMESNIAFMTEEDEDPFEIVSYISADNGNELPLVLRLEIELGDDGQAKSIMDIEPN